jgi:amino acid transporter
MSILTRVKRILVGKPLSTQLEYEERIPKWKALALLSSDALSSVAYATEEILIPLAVFSIAALAYSVPIALAITVLLVIVVMSYRQTIDAYPAGGGAYFVVRENLGEKAGLVAGASLLIDYVLTVAVSISAGVENIASAFPQLQGHIAGISAIVIFLVMIVNLRGFNQTANIFALPTYFFMLSIFTMIAVGCWQVWNGDAVPIVHSGGIPDSTATVALPLVLLRAFASGCAALTGVEAISDRVQEFQDPAPHNAKVTLGWLCVILGALFLGITTLAQSYGVIPHAGETSISQLARAIFGETWIYFAVQSSLAMILVMAAHTAYADFPRISSYLAKDRFLPRQLASVGDRLVFSNGILGLSVSAALLIFIFQDTHHLIPLYAIGVFLSFTLSQVGMVKHHLKKKKPGWRTKVILNGLGTVTTFVVLIVIAMTKFSNGAWMILLLIPMMLFLFTRVNSHYLAVGAELSLTGRSPQGKLQPLKHTVIVPISGIHRGIIDALRYALSISDDVRACYVELDAAAADRMKAEWAKWANEIPLVILKSPYRSVISPLLEYLDDVERTTQNEMITVLVPEFVTSKWWHQILHNQTALLIRAALVFRRGKVVTSVRYHLKNV